MSHAIGTSLTALPWWVRRGIRRYAPHIIRTYNYRDGEAVEKDVSVQMDIVVTDDPFGSLAVWWLHRNGWPVEITDDAGTRTVDAYVDIR